MAGLFLAASFASASLEAAQTLVPAGATWKYLDIGSNQGATWRDPLFDDTAWPSGPAQLGYGDGDERTVVSYGTNASAKFITTYFRHAFQLQNPNLLTNSLHLEVMRDDGAVVYLNGREVFRTGMPAGSVNHLTPANITVGGADESAFQEHLIPPGDLVPGSNVVAVEIHQVNGTSTDISFDLRLSTYDGPPVVSLAREPYLQLLTSTSVVVRWRTDRPAASLVRYGASPANLDQVAQLTTPTTNHVVPLQGLSPDTRYYYAACTTNQILAASTNHFFATGPPPGTPKPTRIWVLGDSGSPTTGAMNVRNAYQAFTGARSTDLILMLGDNAYDNGTDAEQQAAIFNMYRAFLRSAPLWPALGNHDTANSSSPPASLPHFVNFSLPTAGEAGGFPSGTEKYFSFDHANIHFVCLDSMSSDRTTNGPMLTWLRTDLAINTQDWVVAYWHHPPYSRGSVNSDTTTESVQMRTAAVPMLEAAGVDLVLGGHSHAYERSYLIDGHYGSSATFQNSMKKNAGNGRENGDGIYYKLGTTSGHQGTVYVVLGSSSKLESGSFGHPAMASSIASLGSLVVDVNSRRLDARFLDSTGVTRDWFTIQKTVPTSILITRQPQEQKVHAGTTVSFTVEAVGPSPIAYQWRKDGVRLNGATNTSITLVNVQEPDDGFYDVLLSDGMGTLVSAAARLAVLITPEVLLPPTDLTVAVGQPITLSVLCRGTLPMSYRWRRGFRTLTNLTLYSHQCFLTIDHAQTNDQGAYTVVLTNDAFYLPGILSSTGVVTVLEDEDEDSIPDAWEAAHGLSSEDPSDAGFDADQDGLKNAAEFGAGTDPNDPTSKLQIDRILFSDDVTLEFLAMSNRTYALQYADQLPHTQWVSLADIPAARTNRVLSIRDPFPTPARYYRLQTPP